MLQTPVSPTMTTPHPTTRETLPVVMGHEYVRHGLVSVRRPLNRAYSRFSGTIVELGKSVDASKFSVGQNVVVCAVYQFLYTSAKHDCSEPLISCGKCGPCIAGTRNLCRDISFVVGLSFRWLTSPSVACLDSMLQGIGGWGGGLAEYTVTNEDLVHVLPNNIPCESHYNAFANAG